MNVLFFLNYYAYNVVQTGVSKSKKRINYENPGIDILDAFAATGIRSIRYFNEVPNVRSVVVNDYDEDSISRIRENLTMNGISQSHCVPNLEDCTRVMYNRSFDDEMKFDVIDLDPYGSAVEFLDCAVKAIDDGGLLCVTCTDLAVLCGTYPETCWAKCFSFFIT